MLKKITILILLCYCGVSSFSFAINDEVYMQTDKDKIYLKEQTKSTRRSSILVSACIEANTLTCVVENYTGSAFVSITGSGGTQETTFYVDNIGQSVVDISFLPAGEYTITVNLEGNIYEGVFEKR